MFWSKKKNAAVEFLLIGLGNPGQPYAHTRHNTGWWVLDELARRHGVVRREHRHQGHTEHSRISGLNVALIKPTTYYNRVGQCAKAWSAEYPEAGFAVVHDDIALAIGKLRLRGEGRSGGSNGVQSLIDSLGTELFTRVKIGVGAPPSGVDAADYVLEQPSAAELKQIHEAVHLAADMLEKVIGDDWQGALDLLTRRGMEAK